MVVGVRYIELCAAGVGCHLLRDNWATLQLVQREVPEASRTPGNRHQTERGQAEKRYEGVFVMKSLESHFS